MGPSTARSKARGFGGTRNMPLTFVLLTPLLKLGIEPVHAALLVTLLGDALLLSGGVCPPAPPGPGQVAGLRLRRPDPRLPRRPLRRHHLPWGTLPRRAEPLGTWLGRNPSSRHSQAGRFIRRSRPRAASPARRRLLHARVRRQAHRALGPWRRNPGAAALRPVEGRPQAGAVRRRRRRLLVGLTNLASGGRFLDNLIKCAPGGMGAKSLENWSNAITDRGFTRDRMARIVTLLAATGFVVMLLRARAGPTSAKPPPSPCSPPPPPRPSSSSPPAPARTTSSTSASPPSCSSPSSFTAAGFPGGSGRRRWPWSRCSWGRCSAPCPR